MAMWSRSVSQNDILHEIASIVVIVGVEQREEIRVHSDFVVRGDGIDQSEGGSRGIGQMLLREQRSEG